MTAPVMSRYFRHQPCEPGVELYPPRPGDRERSYVIVEPGNRIPRNLAVHEAGHYVVGAGLGLAVERPRLLADESGAICGGRVSLGPDDQTRGPRDRKVWERADAEARQNGSLLLAALYVAGYHAELLASALVPLSGVIACEGVDLYHAEKWLSRAGFPPKTGLIYSQKLADSILRACWKDVVEVAAEVAARPPERD